MSAEDTARITDAVLSNFTVSDDCEITIEANPATISEDKLEAYLTCGINRISIGVQSFNNPLLNMLGRAHDGADGIEAVKMAKRVGFKNINVDMMFGIPMQTEKMWHDSMRQCLLLHPEHVSFYSLQLEEGTPFHKMIVEDKVIKELPADIDRKMYHDAIDMLDSAGYKHYEISNAALPGHECRHNLKYWSYKEYLGLGPGASSFIQGNRFKNSSNMHDYLNFLKSGKAPVKKEDVEHYSKREEMGVYVFTALRKKEGLNIYDFENTFSEEFFDIYAPSALKKYKGYLEMRGANIKLTPSGIDISNAIMSEFV